METKPSFFLPLLLLLVISPFSSSDDSKDKEECTDSLVGLATCLPYIGGTAKNPTPDCCSGLKLIIKNNKKCLCVAIKDRDDPDLGININVTLALGLPAVCNTPVNVSDCPALLKMPPNSPEAQVFYQIGQKNDTSAISPIAEGPSAKVVPNPTNAPAGPTSPRSSSQQKSGSFGKSWLEVQILGGLFLILGLIM